MNAIKPLPAPELCFPAPVDEKWQRERRAFGRMLPDLLVTYRDQFVAIHQEQVVASGPDKIRVAMRAYRQHGPIPIYVGLVSDQRLLPARIPSPRTPKY